MGRKLTLTLLSMFTLYLLIVGNAQMAVAHRPKAKVVINEVELNPGGRKLFNKAWIELFNPSDEVVPIGNWIIEAFGMKHVIIRLPLEAIIRPKGYYVLLIEPDLLSPQGTQLVLRDLSGVEIDRTPTLRDPYGDGRTWQRYPNGADTDTSLDWKFRVGTKGYSNGEVKLATELTSTTTIIEGVIKEEAVSFHYLEGGFTIQAWYPAVVKPGESVNVRIKLKTYRALNFTLEACYGYGAKGWSDWVELFKGPLTAGSERSVSLKVKVPLGTEEGALIMCVKVYFSSPEDYMVVRGTRRPAVFQVVFQGPYVRG